MAWVRPFSQSTDVLPTWDNDTPSNVRTLSVLDLMIDGCAGLVSVVLKLKQVNLDSG